MNQFFAKYTALGNDMIVIDPARCQVAMTPENIRLICDRHFGVGADGICYGPLPEPGDALSMRFYNPDGSEAEKSGNGLRIFARYVWDMEYRHTAVFALSIQNEPIAVRVLDDGRTFALEMGRATFDFVEKEMLVGNEIVRATAVSVGNPHCVIFTDRLERIHDWGPLLETDPAFPNRTNVQLVNVLDNHTIQIEIWERGAGYTLASGTSACATAVTAVQSGRCDGSQPITVQMAGGTLEVVLHGNEITLIGPVTAVYQAEFAPDLLAKLMRTSDG